MTLARLLRPAPSPRDRDAAWRTRASALACALALAACAAPDSQSRGVAPADSGRAAGSPGAGDPSAGASPAAAAPADGTAAMPALTVLGLWRVDQARSAPIVDRRRARLDFGPNGKLTGHTGCNPLSADYSLEGTQLKIGPIQLGREKCGELQLEQEDRILTALERAADARVRPDGLLEIRDKDFVGVLRGTRFEAAQ